LAGAGRTHFHIQARKFLVAAFNTGFVGRALQVVADVMLGELNDRHKISPMEKNVVAAMWGYPKNFFA
jgi:hypothetical protein